MVTEMSEAFLRKLSDIKSVAFVLALGTLTALTATHHVDASAFATSFSALMVAFFGSWAYQEKGGGA